MKIAIVAPLPQPFTFGGAENLWLGLLAHLNAQTPHQADLVKLPSPEGDFWSLAASYERFSRLELSGFDAVIVGKYPAWMVDHPVKACYMLHRLRGLYDAYPGAAEVPAEHAAIPGVARLRRFMCEAAGERSALDDFFGALFALRGGEAEAALAFPGPLTREVVRFLDDIGLHPGRVRRWAAIAATLPARAGYFPEGAEVRVAHPPTSLRVAPGEAQAAFFTVSRLDAPKRLDLVIEAMRHVKADVPLRIAGTGPDEARLRQLAAGDPRIAFLGFLDERAVAREYASALAVPFVPWQEDYGYVALEAMLAAKPVVTVKDAGGPLELVADGRTGLVAAPDARSLGAAMERLARDRALAATLGRAGAARAAQVTWEVVTHALLDGLEAPAVATAAKPRLVVLATFPFHPILHGGQSRAWHLCRGFAERYDVTVVAVDTLPVPGTQGAIAPGVRQVAVARTAKHAQREAALEREMGLANVHVTDIVMPELHRLSPAIGEAVAEAVRGAAVVVLCHPYLLPALDEAGWRGTLWYDAQDVESALKRTMIPENDASRPWLALTEKVERETARRAARILAVTDEDAQALARLYGVPPERIAAVPNGTDAAAIRYCGPAMREAVRARMGLAGERYALFMGSGHKPNIDAVAAIFAASAQLPHVTFLVMGNVCYAFDPASIPPNVRMLGLLPDAERDVALEFAHLALNPVAWGSGTNVKMLDYFAAGIPVVSTATGARGLAAADGTHLLLCDAEGLEATIRRALALDDGALGRMTRAARDLVEARYDWSAIARAALDFAEGGR